MLKSNKNMRFFNLSKLFRGDTGYILPATIVLGLATSIIAGIFTQSVSNSSQTLNTESYQIMAKKAADAGIEYAHTCLLNSTPAWSTVLRPNTNCTGGSATGDTAKDAAILYITNQSTALGTTGSSAVVRSTFTVASKDAQSNISSKGTVELLIGGVVTKTFTATSKMNVGPSYKTYPINDGEALTAIKAQDHACAIANGKLYCWGANSSGQVGNNSTSIFSGVKQPYLVKDAIAGKTVTSVDVSDASTCAIADGLPYCWGGNMQGQLGSNNRTGYNKPTANVPIKQTNGDVLKDHYVVNLSTSPYSWPAVIWPLSIALQHTCAGLDDGSMSCWGSNGFRQLTTKVSACIGLPVGDSCWGGSLFSTPDSNKPILIEGYLNDSDLEVPQKGKKAQRVAASSHDSCLISNGRMYCMGVEVPLALICNTPFFLPSNLVMVDFFDMCPGQYSAGYEMSAKTGIFLKFTQISTGGTQFTIGYTLNDKKIDKDNWELTANVACGQANFTMFCVGNASTVGTQWGGSWKPAWNELEGVDTSSMDNGDVEWLATLDGTYCIVDRGTPKCLMSLLSGVISGVTGGGGGIGSWGALNDTNLHNDVATKIAAGSYFGCAIANGRLYCYGLNGNGQLATGNTSPVTYLSQTGQVGTTPIGTSEGALAASDKISTGGKHSCAAVNEKVVCWGDNTYGQLGQGDHSPLAVPQSVPSLSEFKAVSSISAGQDHTCAVIYGELYCWGRNTNGQLGIGNSTEQTTPVKVTAFNGKRVQSVSAGIDNTCAIANGDLYCWGAGTNGKLGLGNTNSYNTPQLVSGKGDLKSTDAVTRISTGDQHTCAVGGNADAFCWGSNANGRTGLGTASGTQTTPKKLTLGTSALPLGPNNMTPMASEISAGGDFTCGIFNSKASCWGANAKGQGGNGNISWSETVSDPPYWRVCDNNIVLGVLLGPVNCPNSQETTHDVYLNCVKNWLGIWEAPSFSAPYYAILFQGCNTVDGVKKVKVSKKEWSSQEFPSHIVNHPGDEDILVPQALYGNAGTYYATNISAGKEHACAIINGNNSATNGNIWCWGAGANGKIGNNTTTNQFTPQLINAGATVDSSGKRRVAVNVSAGGESTCGVANAVVICWGANEKGQLGNGFTTSTSLPVTVAGYKFKIPYGRGPVF